MAIATQIISVLGILNVEARKIPVAKATVIRKKGIFLNVFSKTYA